MKRLLTQRSTLYKNVMSDVVSELVELARKYDVDSKRIVIMFDKYMTLTRWVLNKWSL